MRSRKLENRIGVAMIPRRDSTLGKLMAGHAVRQANDMRQKVPDKQQKFASARSPTNKVRDLGSGRA
jgi:hypothetical protein